MVVVVSVLSQYPSWHRYETITRRDEVPPVSASAATGLEMHRSTNDTVRAVAEARPIFCAAATTRGARYETATPLARPSEEALAEALFCVRD